MYEKDEKDIIREVSGGYVLTFSRRRMTRRLTQPLPKQDEYIVFNEMRSDSYVTHACRCGRGVARVKSYYQHFVLLEVYYSPQLIESATIRLDDFRVGLVRYRYLTDYVYISDFEYDDLDIDNLHTKIKELIKE